MSDSRIQKLSFSATAFLCAVYFAMTVVLAHLLKPDLNLFSDALSLYALGDSGMLLTTGFYAIAINQGLLALLLLSYDNNRHRIPAILLLLSAMGALLVAYFPTQANPTDLISRLPHITGAIMQFLFFPLALISIIHSSTTRYSIYTKVTAYLSLLLFCILLLIFFVPEFRDFAYFGILEKLNILIITSWLIYYPARQIKTNL